MVYRVFIFLLSSSPPCFELTHRKIHRYIGTLIRKGRHYVSHSYLFTFFFLNILALLWWLDRNTPRLRQDCIFFIDGLWYSHVPADVVWNIPRRVVRDSRVQHRNELVWWNDVSDSFIKVSAFSSKLTIHKIYTHSF